MNDKIWLILMEGIKIIAVLFTCGLFWILIKIMIDIKTLLQSLNEKIKKRNDKDVHK